MFNRREKTVAVQLAGRKLVLDPLPPVLIEPLKAVLSRLVLGVKPPIPPTWFQDLSEAMKYVYLAAQMHDKKIDLPGLGRPTIKEASDAIADLWILTRKKYPRDSHGGIYGR